MIVGTDLQNAIAATTSLVFRCSFGSATGDFRVVGRFVKPIRMHLTYTASGFLFNLAAMISIGVLALANSFSRASSSKLQGFTFSQIFHLVYVGWGWVDIVDVWVLKLIFETDFRLRGGVSKSEVYLEYRSLSIGYWHIKTLRNSYKTILSAYARRNNYKSKRNRCNHRQIPKAMKKDMNKTELNRSQYIRECFQTKIEEQKKKETFQTLDQIRKQLVDASVVLKWPKTNIAN